MIMHVINKRDCLLVFEHLSGGIKSNMGVVHHSTADWKDVYEQCAHAVECSHNLAFLF